MSRGIIGLGRIGKIQGCSLQNLGSARHRAWTRGLVVMGSVRLGCQGMPRHGEMRGRSGDAAEVRLVLSEISDARARIRGREGVTVTQVTVSFGLSFSVTLSMGKRGVNTSTGNKLQTINYKAASYASFAPRFK